VASWSHLARRFAGSLVPFPPRERDVAWVGSVLNPAELAVWQRLSRADRRHSIAVGRRVERALSPAAGPADPRWTAAALLHDAGKLDARLGTFARVGATLVVRAAGRERVTGWAGRSGLRRRLSLYVRHPELGAERLTLAGARPEVATWARAHHAAAVVEHGAPVPGIPDAVVNALLAADDD
jgi:hypothetical protein